MKNKLLDLKILSILGINARIPTSKIAQILKRSKQHITYRIMRLKEKGILGDAHALINTDRLNITKSHYFLEKPCQKKPHSTIASLLFSGKYAQELVCTEKNLFPNEHIIEKVLIQRSFLNLVHLNSYGGNDTSFTKDFLVKRTKGNIDDFDKELIELLSKNAGLQLREMERLLKKPYDTIRYRIKRLIHLGYIKGFIPQINYEKIGYILVAFISKQKPSELLADEKIIWAAKTSKGYIIYALCENITDIHQCAEFAPGADLLLNNKIAQLGFYPNKYL